MTKRRPPARRHTARTHPRTPTRARAVPVSPEVRAAREEARQQARTLRAQARFLRDFAVAGNVSRAARTVKVGRRTVYDWLGNEAFKRLYAEAYDDALDALEEEARRRAVDGVLEPVFQGGVKVGTIPKYSDTLLKLLLEGKRPETFRTRHELFGPKGGPIPLSHTGTVTVYLPDNGRGSVQP